MMHCLCFLPVTLHYLLRCVIALLVALCLSYVNCYVWFGVAIGGCVVVVVVVVGGGGVCVSVVVVALFIVYAVV